MDYKEQLFDQLGGIADSDLAEINELIRLRAEVWLNNFYLFNTECLGNSPETDPGLDGMTDPAVKQYIEWVGERVLDWLENRSTQTKRRKLMIIVPRECYKSTAITQALPVWLNCHVPNISGIIDCAKVDMAEKMLQTTREHFLGNRSTSKLIETMGNMRGSGKWNTRQITTDLRQDMARRDPTVWTTGVEVGSTGMHSDYYIMDDPITQELMTDVWFDTVWHHYKGTLPVVRKDGLFVLVATRYGESDLCGRIIEREIEPAARRVFGRDEFPEEDFQRNWHRYAQHAGWDVVFRQVHDEDENCVFPVVWPADRIQELRDIDESEYASQLQNMPADRKDAPITRELVERLRCGVSEIPATAFNKVTMHMDLAWKDEENYLDGKGDYSVIQVWLHDDDGTCYYWDGWRGKEKMDDGFKRAWLQMLQDLAAKDMWPQLMTYDKQVGGEGNVSEFWFRQTATSMGFFCPPILRLPRGGTKKVSRILAAARYWRDGRVRLVDGGRESQSLVHEMLQIGYSQFDDMADAAADVFHTDVYRPGKLSKAGSMSARRAEEVWSTAVEHMRPQEEFTFGGSPELERAAMDFFNDPRMQ